MSSLNQTSMRRPDGTHRVVVTGMGAVTPAGVGVTALWDALTQKKCCIAPITKFDTTDFEVKNAAEVKDFDAVACGISKKEARRFDLFVQYALVAADEALAQSGLNMEQVDPTRVGVSFGSGIGGIQSMEDGAEVMASKGVKRVSPLIIPSMIGNMAAGNLAIRYGMKGECVNVVTACATSTHCIGNAVRSIRHGYADVMLAGGTEASISPLSIAGFMNLGALSKSTDPERASMPFDKDRGGFVSGEGAGALILESLEHAQARGASILAEITGFGSTGDAYHMTSPDPEANGVVRAMEQALAEGGFTPADLGHLNAHGTGTAANDKTESAALLKLCGEEAGRKVPVTSCKGAVGHMLGAAGAVECIATVLSVANACVPPTCGFTEPDDQTNVNVASRLIMNLPQKVALTNNLGFGGHNACLAISPYVAEGPKED